MKKVAMSWSGGKDSTWTLHKLKQDPEVEVVSLVTAIEDRGDSVILTMLHRRLVRKQAQALGLPLREFHARKLDPTGEYFELPSRLISTLIAEGVTHIAFGDISNQSTREAREANLAGTGLEPLFPLWGRDDHELANEIAAGGVKAIVVSVDPERLDPRVLGRQFDGRFTGELPAEVDWCGENEEFQTFVYDSPDFTDPLKLIPGGRTKLGKRWVLELFPESA